jgi:glutamyl-tRNA synthetase
LLTEDSRKLLAAAHAALGQVASWDHSGIEAAVRELAESEGVKLG